MKASYQLSQSQRAGKGLVSQEVEKLYLGNSQDNILTGTLESVH